MAVARLTGKTLDDAMPEGAPAGAKEDEEAAAAGPRSARVGLYAAGDATATAIAALEVARRFVEGIHAVIDVSLRPRPRRAGLSPKTRKRKPKPSLATLPSDPRRSSAPPSAG